MAHQLGIPSGKVILNEQVELIIRNDGQDQITDILDLIILHNLSKLSTTFTCIEMSKIPLILELNSLPHINELLLKYQVDDVEKFMEKFLIKAIINKKIKGSIDQIAGIVSFEQEKVEAKIDWELKVSDVLNELDNIRAHLEAK
ncbi:BA75_04621T0 [Komagataella pastoris]|uniref:BA75_04621T0 n=1 Tax=Komagataella pastoris TaxID=4922 RepID=A0A1B2JHL1_PICPA|nr:BA75_04621T0 [Komagataella pastoris]